MASFWSSLASAALIAPACAIFGKVAERLTLPHITGYLVAGVLVGPFVLGVLSTTAVSNLWVLDQACLSLIALAAGAELQLEQLAKIKKQVTLVTAAISLVTWGAVYTTMLLLAPAISVTHSMRLYQIHAFCGLCATLMVARSPASAIAIIQETRGKGPFCSLVMAVVVVKDVLVIVAFALNIEIARTLFSSAAGPASFAQLMEPFSSILVAVTLGTCGSFIVMAILQVMPPSGRGLAAASLRMAVLLVLSTSMFEVASMFEAEPLLACAIAGLLCTNRMQDKEREDFHHTLENMMPHINLAFFTLAGASLKVSALLESLWLGSIVFVVRTAAVYFGSYAGCWLSDSPPEHRKRMWQSMLTQAGVALGLARMVANRFPTWGPHFQTLAASIIILNLCAGPPLFRHAIVSVGESRAYGGRKADDSSPEAPHSPRDYDASAV